MTDNRKFWKTVKHFFTDKCKSSNNSILAENEDEESSKKIKENFDSESFSFETVFKKYFLNLIKEILGNKATASNDIPVSVLKESISANYEKLTDIFNNCIRSGTFSKVHKKAEVTPVFKKGDCTTKTDYCQVSTLSSFSKFLEN